jgi:hypothetical protein
MNCPTPNKIRYQNEAAAQRFGVMRGQRWYQCPCGNWHLTSSAIDSAKLKQALTQEERVNKSSVRSLRYKQVTRGSLADIVKHENKAAADKATLKRIEEDEKRAKQAKELRLAHAPHLEVGQEVRHPEWGSGIVTGLHPKRIKTVRCAWENHPEKNWAFMSTEPLEIIEL